MNKMCIRDRVLGGGYYLRDLLLQFIKISLPLLLVAVFMAAIGVGSQTKFLFTMKNAAPKFSRLNPIGAVSYTHLDVYKRQLPS